MVQGFSDGLGHIIQSRSLLLILKGTSPFGGNVPIPKPLISGSGIFPSSSISNDWSSIAKDIKISCFAKCLPGHIRFPPPKGSHVPAVLSRENLGVSFNGGSVRDSDIFPSLSDGVACGVDKSGDTFSGPLVGSFGLMMNLSGQKSSTRWGWLFVPVFHVSLSM